MNKLTDKQIASINQNIAEKEAQPFEIKEWEGLSRISKEPYDLDEHENFYKYKNIFDKAAHLCYLIAREKPFFSCNIKTAIISSITFLELNDVKLIDYSEDLINLADILDNGTEADLCCWFISHSDSKKINVQ